MEVGKGNKIHVEYEGTFEDGEVFDSTQNHGGDPLVFVAGEGMVVPGFDKAVIGMKVGEEKKVTIAPEQAYGTPNPQAIQKVPKRVMPGEVKEGMQIGVPMQNGQMIPAVITKVESDMVTIDLNHPLAGKTLIFTIKIVKIEK
jgi:FKBP-type peptidyl-prolyl cis-trans isomerase 2